MCFFAYQAHPKIPVISLTVLNVMKTMSNEEQQAIFHVDEVVRCMLQRSKNLAQEEEAKPRTIFTLLEYLSVMGMVSPQYHSTKQLHKDQVVGWD